MKTERPTNRLIHEKSPYLLQHAHNPVDWYPWGEEAFEKARREQKPIFLSIGYSTCHWCHVMERESFEDPAVAELLNEHFVSIKMDREERPDVDALYMQAVMQMTGQGGWPLSIFITPELKPFHGGTYFPPEDRWGQVGFKSVLRGVAQAWANRRQEILQSAQALTEALRVERWTPPTEKAPLSEPLLTQAFQAFSSSYDGVYGGFHPAPKFPRSHSLSFLLRYWKRSHDPEVLRIVEGTLKAMAAGGIADHLAGGFHRYSTDAQWHVPHFEKMLYDQALLAKTYLETFQATQNPSYADTARGIFKYVLTEMTGPEGAFYSAEDADSEPTPGSAEKVEGAFYVWTAKELEQLLGAERAQILGYLYGVKSEGNVQNDPTGEFAGKNILYRAHTVKEAAKEFQRSEKEIEQLVQETRETLFEVRRRRPRPHRDDKVLVDWNGLMISSLAFGSRVLEEPRYAQAAERAARFILEKLVRKEGRLFHRYRDGEVAILGTLEDYAFFIHGLVDLYEATFEVEYLFEARRLTQEMIRLFWDEEGGAFFLVGSDAEQLLVRQKEVYDGAIPSGNSVAALDLLRVGRLTANPELESKAGRLMEVFLGQVAQNPSAYPQLLMALDFSLGPSNEIVIAGGPGESGTEEMIRAIYLRFLPNKVVALHPPGKAGRKIEELASFLKGQGMLEGKPTAYVCQNYTCQLPVTAVEKLKELLK